MPTTSNNAMNISHDMIFERVKDLIINKSQDLITNKTSATKDMITQETRFVEDLGADSLALVELTMSLEKEFRIEIPDEKAEKIVTVGDAVRFVGEALGESMKN